MSRHPLLSRDVRVGQLGEWWSLVDSVEENKGTSDETDVYRVKFKDGSKVGQLALPGLVLVT